MYLDTATSSVIHPEAQEFPCWLSGQRAFAAQSSSITITASICLSGTGGNPTATTKENFEPRRWRGGCRSTYSQSSQISDPQIASSILKQVPRAVHSSHTNYSRRLRASLFSARGFQCIDRGGSCCHKSTGFPGGCAMGQPASRKRAVRPVLQVSSLRFDPVTS